MLAAARTPSVQGWGRAPSALGAAGAPSALGAAGAPSALRAPRALSVLGDGERAPSVLMRGSKGTTRSRGGRWHGCLFCLRIYDMNIAAHALSHIAAFK